MRDRAEVTMTAQTDEGFLVIYTDETAARVTVEETPDPGPDEREAV